MDILMRLIDVLLVLVGFYIGRQTKESGSRTSLLPKLPLFDDIAGPISPYEESLKQRKVSL